MRTTFLAAVLAVLVLTPVMSVYADITGSFSVKEVVGPDKVRIAFHGLPIVVRQQEM